MIDDEQVYCPTCITTKYEEGGKFISEPHHFIVDGANFVFCERHEVYQSELRKAIEILENLHKLCLCQVGRPIIKRTIGVLLGRKVKPVTFEKVIDRQRRKAERIGNIFPTANEEQVMKILSDLPVPEYDADFGKDEDK